jgi:hypothetical protein
VSYSAQLELPFGDWIKHLGGIAVDRSGSAYATDLHYGQVWKHSPGIQDDVLSSQLGQATSVRWTILTTSTSSTNSTIGY